MEKPWFPVDFPLNKTIDLSQTGGFERTHHRLPRQTSLAADRRPEHREGDGFSRWDFHQWGYLNSWMIYSGKSQTKMDDDWGYPMNLGKYLGCNWISWGLVVMETPSPESPLFHSLRIGNRWRFMDSWLTERGMKNRGWD